MRRDRSWRRHGLDAVLVLLFAVTVLLVRQAFDASPSPARLTSVDPGPSEAPATVPTPTGTTGVPAPVAPKGLFLEVVDPNTAFRIAAGQECGTTAVSLERTRDGGRQWESRVTPLRRVGGVAFVTPTRGWAAGLGGTCRPEIYRTDDAGDTWAPVAYAGEEVVGLDATADGGWLLLRATGVTATGSRILRTTDSFATLRGVVDPCTEGPATAAPTAITALSGRSAVIACTATPRAEGQPRLLLTTANAGASWAELAGARRVGPDDGGRRDGLDGDGVLLGVEAGDASRVYALLRGAGCREGQLRRSADSGRNWTALPCVSAAQPVDSLLAAAFTAADDGWLVAARGPALVTLRTADGGRTWTAAG